MGKRIFWQYSQWKLLYYPLSAVYWLLRGVFEEVLFNYLSEYTKTRAGWIVDIINWAELHPALSTSILMFLIGVVIAVWAIRDARKKLNGIYKIEDILLKMFNLALDVARSKAQTIKLDVQWDTTMKRIAKDIVGIDATKYSGKDMKDRKQMAKIEKEVRKVTPTDKDTVPIFKLMASAMVNNGYGIEEKELTKKRQYKKLKQKLDILRKVPSNQINNAINKCLDYIYTLSNIYIHHLARMRITVGLSQETLAEMRNFIQAQENNTGDMSKCLTELRIEVDNFIGGDKDDRKR